MKVPSDPAQVIVNHASFRVRLAPPARPAGQPAPPAGNVRPGRPVSAAEETAPLPIVPSSVRSSTGEYATFGAGGVGDATAGSGRGAQAPVPRSPVVPAPASAPAQPGTTGRRRTPVMWSGKAGPGDAAATQLLQAVQSTGTRLVPRVGGNARGRDDGNLYETRAFQDTAYDGSVHDGSGYEEFDGDLGVVEPRAPASRRPCVIGPRSPLPGWVPAQGAPEAPGDADMDVLDADERGRPFATDDGHDHAYDYYGHGYEGSGYGDYDDRGHLDGSPTGDEYEDADRAAPDDRPAMGGRLARRARGGGRRAAYHPGRGRNPGTFLLPLRVFLGGICVYAGMSKLCDPAFFEGGGRGSMVKWLSSLEPWAVATPLHDFALGHPVGAGLTVAFIQIVVGMLTVLGLWQRFAAGLGMLLSVALLVTVSWRSAPAYEAPDIIYLAAWSPLLIAGAPAYSFDSRLANEAWRKLGPRSSLFELRRWVLRRGAVIATVVVGLTLLIGSALGGAVRASSYGTDAPDPDSPPTNHLPGQPLPSDSQGADQRERKRDRESKTPSAAPSTPEKSRTPDGQPSDTGSLGGTGEQPGQGGTDRTPQQPQQPPPPPSEPQRPEPSDSGGGGALGGILGAGGLLGMPEKSSGRYTSA